MLARNTGRERRELEADMTGFPSNADEHGETGTRVCLTGGLGNSSQRRAKKFLGNKKGRRKKTGHDGHGRV